MRQVDVAPTLAALLGTQLETASGRSLIGLLRVSAVPAETGPRASAEALPRVR
jgi:hypothetical protein